MGVGRRSFGGGAVGEVEVDEGRDETGCCENRWHAPVSDAVFTPSRHALLGIISRKPILFNGHGLSLTFRLCAGNKEYMGSEAEIRCSLRFYNTPIRFNSCK